MYNSVGDCVSGLSFFVLQLLVVTSGSGLLWSISVPLFLPIYTFVLTPLSTFLFACAVLSCLSLAYMFVSFTKMSCFYVSLFVHNYR